MQSGARCNPRACHMLATVLLLLSEDFMVILCVFYQKWLPANIWQQVPDKD